MDSKPLEYRGKDPWSKTLNWYFFATANYFLYGESIIYYFKVPIPQRNGLFVPLIPSIVACRLCGRKLPPVRHEP
jgi:hypothetical protein